MSMLDCTVAAKAACFSAVLSMHGYRKKSLSLSGALSAFAVGFVVVSCGMTSTMALLTFYQTGSYLTKRGAAVKRRIEEKYVTSGNRSAWQVLCNGGAAAVVCGASVVRHAGFFPDKIWCLAVVGQLAALQADTWSSELGVLSKRQPRMVVGLRAVPRGTNGAVTLDGLAAALASGVLSGAVCCITAYGYPAGAAGASISEIFLTCVGAAVAGSVVDSILGQFLQQSVQLKSGHMTDGKDLEADGRRDEVVGRGHAAGTGTVVGGWNVLSNNGVNFVTSLLVGVGIVAVVRTMQGGVGAIWR